ncbi:hypothetical protein Q3G72_020380 [Acer saccharum]|nr:hypothetical protein Q3G72_020380 [Acer saccharum]
MVSPHKGEKVVSNPSSQRDVCMGEESATDIRLERQMHGGEVLSSSLNAYAPDDGMANQLDNAKVLDLSIGPVVGPEEDSNLVLVGTTQPSLRKGPNSNPSNPMPIDIGPAINIEGGGQRIETNESLNVEVSKPSKWKRVKQSSKAGTSEGNLGEIAGKRRNLDQGIEEGKRVRRDSGVGDEEALVSTDCISGDSQCMEEFLGIGGFNVGRSLATDKRSTEAVGLGFVEGIDGVNRSGRIMDEVVTRSQVSLQSITEEVFCWSKDFLVEYSRSFQVNIQKVYASPHLCPYWIPPEVGKFKMNCAAAVDIHHERTGIGVVIRDADGEVLACCSQRLETNMSNKAAKLIAIQKGIQFGVDCGFPSCVAELDDAEVIDWIVSGSLLDSEFGAVLVELKNLADGPIGQLFRYVTKSANKAAHGLSRYAMGIMEDTYWLEEFPMCIGRVIDSDKPG